MSSVYQWKLPLYASVNAQAAGEFLKNLEARDGEVVPVKVVEESQDGGAVLHPCFEWDDQKAAEAHRITQAKGVIRNIAVVHVAEERREPVVVRAFISSRKEDTDEPKYFHMDTVLSDEKLKKRMVDDAFKELCEFRNKYRELSEFAAIFQVIDNISLVTV